MALAWTMLLLVGVAVAALALALFVLRARPRKPQDTVLALYLLVLCGASAAVPVASLFPLGFTNAMWRSAFDRAFALASYPLLLALAGMLGVPLARPFASRAGRWLAYGLAGGVFAFVLLFPGWIFTLTWTGTTWRSAWLPVTIRLVLLLTPLVVAYAGLVAIQAYRRAQPRSLERARARAVLVALVLLEAPVALNALFMQGLEAYDHDVHLAYMETPVFNALLFVDVACDLLGLAVLVHGMLRLQLFDIDLRVKRTIRRGTLVAAFVTTAVVVAELAQIWVSSTLGVIAGLVVALALVFVKRPLEQAAERVADSAMPNVRDTPQWRDERKSEMYRTAVRLAFADRVISRDEEIHLADLATQLGIDARRALDLRHSVEGETAAT